MAETVEDPHLAKPKPPITAPRERGEECCYNCSAHHLCLQYDIECLLNHSRWERVFHPLKEYNDLVAEFVVADKRYCFEVKADTIIQHNPDGSTTEVSQERKNGVLMLIHAYFDGEDCKISFKTKAEVFEYA